MQHLATTSPIPGLFCAAPCPEVRTNVKGLSLIGRPPRCPGITCVPLALAADRFGYVTAVTLHSSHGAVLAFMIDPEMDDSNPEITKLFLRVTAVESVVLIVAGLGLLLFPSIMRPLWPWELAPFNALLLGSIYSASLVATVMTVYFRRWMPARIVAPMIFLFATVVLVVSLANLDRFDLGHYSTWLWILLYVGIPANAAYYMFLQRGLSLHRSHPLANPWRNLLLVPVLGLGVYGLGLLIAPDTFSSFWPWGIDAFHGRMYSVAYLTPGLGALLLWRAAAPAESLTLGLTMVAGGLTPMVGLVIVDDNVGGKVDWSTSGTWLWLGTFGIILAVGLGLAWRSRIAPPQAES